MSTENLTVEQAEALLNETFNSLQKQEPVGTMQAIVPTEQVVETTTPAPVVEETPAVVEETPQPEATTAAPAPAASETTPTPSSEPANPYAWVEALPDEVKQKVILEINERYKHEHQARSDAGRVKALQRKLLEQEQRAAQAKQPASQPAPAGSQPTTPESWQSLAKGDPELAEAIEARVKSEIETAVGSVRNELQEMKKLAVDPLHEQNAQEYRQAQYQELKRIVPNVDEVIRSREYNTWLENDASDGIRELARRSLDHRDAVNVLRAYAADMQAMGYDRVPPAPAAAAATTNADAIAEARNKQLQSPAPRTTVSVAPVASLNANGPMTKDDAQAYFDQVVAKLMKKT